MKKFVPLLLVLGAIAVTVVMFLSQPEPVKAAAPEAALAVKTQILKSTSVTLEVESQGTVQPRRAHLLFQKFQGQFLSYPSSLL